MSKIEIKGTVKAVGSPRTVKDKLIIQSVLIFVPGFTDGFGDKKGKDAMFPVDVFNEDIERLSFDKNMGAKVVCQCYLNSNPNPEKEGQYFLSLRLKDAQFVK